VASLGVIAGEERFDGRVHPHPHLLCGSCGRILDLPVPDRELLERLAFYTNGEGTAGLSIDFRRTLFYGTCGECGAGNGGYEKTDRDKAPPGSGGS
jgi:Fur family peroxide stress response transcriptional regulator